MLLLFDIDGTLLLKAAREHAEAIEEAVHRVHRVRLPEGARVETAGRTDLAIARSILQLAGVSADRIDRGMAEVRRVAVEEYARRVPGDLSARVAPGVPELLEAVTSRPGVVCTLLTGNLEPIARLKLRAAGLGGSFAAGQGAYGSDDEDRAALPEIARARAGQAGQVDGAPYPRRRTVVIGDTPRDIACARADGVPVIAVATGAYPAGALTGADHVVAGASEVLPALEALGLPA